MRVEGDATHDGDGPVLKSHELWASILGGVVGDAIEDFSIQSDLRIDELTGDVVLQYVDQVGGIQLDLRLAVGNEIPQPVSAIDDPRSLVLNTEVEVGALREPVREEADGPGGSHHSLDARHADSLLPHQPSLRDLNGEGGAAEVVGEFGRVDGGPDPVAPEVAHRIQLSQVDGTRNRLARTQLDRVDLIVGIRRGDRASIEGLDLESKPFLPFHIGKKKAVPREVSDADGGQERFVGDVEVPLEGEINHDLGTKVFR